MYCFSYQGKLVEGADQATVKVNLARLFSITEAQVAQLFEGDKEFFRDELDQSTAQDYLTLFGRAGALGHIHESTPESKVTNRGVDRPANISVKQQRISDKPTRLVDLINGRVGGKKNDHQAHITLSGQKTCTKIGGQVAYGSQVMKSLNAEEKSNTNQQNAGPEVSELPPNKLSPKSQEVKHNKKSSAALWLRIGGMAVVGTMIADEKLQSALIIDRYGLDMGYLPLVIAHIPLVIGCYLLAIEKRLLPIFRFLGLLSFAGLSLLLLVPAKGARNHKIGLGALAVTAFSFGVFIYWIGGALQTSEDIQNHSDRLLILRDGREEYPAGARQEQLQHYSSEQNELYQAMGDIITLLNSDELRPDQATELSNALMNEVARYIAWRQYQQYLHHTNGKALPEGLNSEFQKNDEIKIGGMLRSITPQSNKRLYESVQSWSNGPVDETEYAKTIALRRQLDQIFDAVRDGWLAQTEIGRSNKADSQPSGRPPAIDIAMLRLPNLNGADLVKFKHHVEYVFSSGSLSGKTLAIGFYTVKNKPRWNSKVSYSPKYKLINNEVSSFYMSGLINVFHRYTNPAF